ncbi:MAG: serine/threonine-protein kinase [Acidobacteriota bacterium]
MDRSRWTEIKPLLDRALDLPLSKRSDFVSARCAHDPDLAQEIEAYLELEPEVEELLEEPIVDLIAGRSQDYRAGQQLGPYRLEEEIARGGMGVVYRARRIEGGFAQRVAVKVLKRGYDTGGLVRRFRTEQQILSDLDHPNITRLLDGGATSDGLPYLVMELVEGQRLDRYCLEHKPDLETRLRLFESICSAVHAAHQRMVVHCDLKPSNILVTRQGAVKLLDFGIAKVLRQGATGTTKTLSVRLGTAPYASPEQIAGQPISVSSDVYSLGCLLYLLLTHRVPGSGSGRAILLPSRAAEDEGASLPFSGDELRGDLDAIVLKATEREPEKRYASAAALAEEIDRMRKRQPLEAQTYTFGRALQLFAQRWPRELAFTALLTLLLAAAGTIIVRQSFDTRIESARANEARAAYFEMIELLDETSDESAPEAAQTALERLTAGEPFSGPADMAQLYDRLGRAFLRRGALDQGTELLNRSRRLLVEAGLPESEEMAASYNNLGLALRKQGHIEQAARLYRLSLDLYERHPEWSEEEKLDVLHNLANVESLRGDHQTAEALYRELLPRRRAVHGEESPEAARTAMNLGSLLVRRNRLEEADPYLESALLFAEKVYGPEHPRVATRLINYAALKDAQDLGEEAIALFRRALEIRRASYGDDSARTALAESALGVALLNRGHEGDLEEALGLLRRAEATHRELRGNENDATLIVQRNLAEAELAGGDAAEAERLLREVLENSDARPEASSWRTADARSLLAEALTAQNKLDEAADFLDEGVVEVISEARGEESRYAKDAQIRLDDLREERESLSL